MRGGTAAHSARPRADVRDGGEEKTVTAKENRAKTLFFMTAGVLLMAAGIYFFKIPNGFATGGVSGIGTLLGRLTPFSP